MKILISIRILLILLLLGCEKQSPMEECIDNFIDAGDLIRYTDQKIDGQFYYELYEASDEFYFLAGHHYIDFLSTPTNCNGESTCEDLTLSTCFQFLEGSIAHGIVAISKN